MIVRRFLDWSRSAGSGGRAEAASALARAWLYSELDPPQRDEAMAALTTLLDDPAPSVRLALAEAFASAAEAPAHLVVALAQDQGEVAAPLLARSPVLRCSDLIDCVAIGDERAHQAIACRMNLSPAVCGAMAEIAGPEALVALMRNRSAEIPSFAYRRAIERHGGGDAALREAILAREDVPAGVRHMLVVAVSDALSHFVSACAWMRPERGRRIVAEAREAAALTISADAAACADLVGHLRETGQLTASLLLRALLSGRLDLLETALSELSGQPARRVAAILSDRRGAGFAALYCRARLPDGLFPAFHAALAAWRDLDRDPTGERPAALSRRLIERTLTALGDAPASEQAGLFAMLRRFEAEAAREDARLFIADLMQSPLDDLEADIRRLVEEEAALAA